MGTARADGRLGEVGRTASLGPVSRARTARRVGLHPHLPDMPRYFRAALLIAGAAVAAAGLFAVFGDLKTDITFADDFCAQAVRDPEGMRERILREVEIGTPYGALLTAMEGVLAVSYVEEFGDPPRGELQYSLLPESADWIGRAVVLQRECTHVVGRDVWRVYLFVNNVNIVEKVDVIYFFSGGNFSSRGMDFRFERFNTNDDAKAALLDMLGGQLELSEIPLLRKILRDAGAREMPNLEHRNLFSTIMLYSREYNIELWNTALRKVTKHIISVDEDEKSGAISLMIN